MTARRPTRFESWFEERLPLVEIRELAARKRVPVHRHTFWYLFGGLALFFLAVQVVTGILLSLYYVPTPEGAHESVRRIVNEVPHGWLIRSMHSWGANLLVATVFVHMFSAYFMRAYRKPRELVWLTGVAAFFIVLGFGFTGYLLPWDTTGYFATLIGTEVPRTVPIVGDLGVSILKGGEEIGGDTLSRIHTIHIIILPLTLFIIGICHLVFNLYYGTSIPRGVLGSVRDVPFFPNFLYRDIVAWSVGLGMLIVMASLVPRGLEEKANPFASAPLGIRPEWYFLPLFQAMRLAPATVAGVSGELVVNLGVVVGIGLWFAVPFLDSRANQDRGGGRLQAAIGIGLIVGITVLMVMGYAIP